jgi:hypothetical protein
MAEQEQEADRRNRAMLAGVRAPAIPEVNVWENIQFAFTRSFALDLTTTSIQRTLDYLVVEYLPAHSAGKLIKGICLLPLLIW